MDSRVYAFLLLCIILAANGDEDMPASIETEKIRDPKLSIFQVVKFANTHCTGTGTKNGTCYTSGECDNIGGSSEGTCADGFGVCCIVTITTGESLSTNNSYISIPSGISSGSHQYTVCPCSDDICRIKFDFTSFTLAGPITDQGSVVEDDTDVPNPASVATGTCATDTFQITSPSGRGSPVICGVNDNQHMFIDAAGSECLKVWAGIGETTTVTRGVELKVTQYRCGDEQGGPPGCLQYFENTSGKIRSFNFPDYSPGATVTYKVTHLINQHYKICFRRGNGKEILCMIPCSFTVGETGTIEGGAATSQPSFGLSLSDDEAGQSIVDTECSTDYIYIAATGFVDTIESEFASATSEQDEEPENDDPSRFCGRYFGTTDGGAAFLTAISLQTSVCTYTTPFEVGVNFDSHEICTNSGGPDTCEGALEEGNLGGGGGILGFSLCYIQHTPPITV